MGLLPTLTVLLDDGTGTFPFDISSKVMAVDGYEITRGRDDWDGAVTAGGLTLTLNNSDGRFTPGSTILATPSPIKVDARIRVIEGISGFGLGGFGTGLFGGSITRFTGYVKSWPVAWPAVVTSFSTVEITATDAQARAERRTLRSMPEEEVLTHSPGGYYQLAEEQGSTAAGDTSGTAQPPLRLTGVDPTGFAFGATLLGDFTGASFIGHGPANSVSLHANGGTFTSSSICYTFIVASATPGGPIGQDWIPVLIGGGGPRINTTGAVEWQAATSPGSITDGLPHVVSVQAGAGLSSDIWVDGVKVALSATVSGMWATNTSFGASIVGNTVASAASTIGQVSFGARMTDASVAAIHAAYLNGLAGESVTARITRLAGYAGIPLGTLDTSATNVSAMALAGTSAGEAIQTTVETEMGVAYIDGTGSLTFHNRNKVVGKTVPDLILDRQWVTPEILPVVDDQRIVNYFEATAAGTGAPTVVTDTTSTTSHGRYPQSQTYLVQTDAEALDRASWIVGKFAEPTPRFGTLTVNLYGMSSPQASTTLAALEVDCWLRVTSLASQNPGGTVADVVVQGWRETVTAESWTITCNVVAHSLYAPVFMLDVSQLDVDTSLYV